MFRVWRGVKDRRLDSKGSRIADDSRIIPSLSVCTRLRTSINHDAENIRGIRNTYVTNYTGVNYPESRRIQPGENSRDQNKFSRPVSSLDCTVVGLYPILCVSLKRVSNAFPGCCLLLPTASGSASPGKSR